MTYKNVAQNTETLEPLDEDMIPDTCSESDYQLREMYLRHFIFDQKFACVGCPISRPSKVFGKMTIDLQSNLLTQSNAHGAAFRHIWRFSHCGLFTSAIERSFLWSKGVLKFLRDSQRIFLETTSENNYSILTEDSHSISIIALSILFPQSPYRLVDMCLLSHVLDDSHVSFL